MKSMTGYGRAKLEKNNRVYVIEIKSVNNRYSDISIKMPRIFGPLEEKIKSKITNSITRGKIDVFITFENYSAKGKNVIINRELVEMYIKELKDVALLNNLSSDFRIIDITKFPEVLTVKTDDEDMEIIWNEIEECLNEALDSFINMRKNEGNKIKEDLKKRLILFENNVNIVAKSSETVVSEYIKKLRNRIKELVEIEVDENRLAQEIVIYSDKCSIEEEITRLRSHIEQFRELIEQEKPIGKKIDFLIQEMNRETNTIASKSGKLDITNNVIEMKTELEDIREQVQNIE